MTDERIEPTKEKCKVCGERIYYGIVPGRDEMGFLHHDYFCGCWPEPPNNRDVQDIYEPDQEAEKEEKS